MNCAQCEDRLSDYLEHTIAASERAAVELHLSCCPACAELLDGMREVLQLTGAFPAIEPPPWLASRIIANTPRVVRENWLDTVLAIGRWFVEPRTAMGLLTTALMIGWIGSLPGVSADLTAAIRNPAAVYYRAYDQAVRTFYHAPVVTQIRSDIERLREIS